MAFVQMEHAGVDPQRAQSPHAADAKHDLLAKAAVGLGHVEAVGDVPQVLGVRLEVRVEEKQRHPPDLHAPDGDPHVAAADRSLDLDARHLAHRQLGSPVFVIHLDLPAVRIDVLPAKSLPVQQADRDQREPQVAGRFQVVAGQDPESTGIDRQAFGKSELEREVRDGERRLGVHEPRMPVVVLLVGGFCALERLLDLGPRPRPQNAILAQLVEQQHRVLTCRLPEFRVERAKQSLDSGLPCPQQVVGELF